MALFILAATLVAANEHLFKFSPVLENVSDDKGDLRFDHKADELMNIAEAICN